MCGNCVHGLCVGALWGLLGAVCVGAVRILLFFHSTRACIGLDEAI